jgi:hypothetical protein
VISIGVVRGYAFSDPPTVTVMTRKVYLGGDIDRPSDCCQQFRMLPTEAWRETKPTHAAPQCVIQATPEDVGAARRLIVPQADPLRAVAVENLTGWPISVIAGEWMNSWWDTHAYQQSNWRDTGRQGWGWSQPGSRPERILRTDIGRDLTQTRWSTSR